MTPSSETPDWQDVLEGKGKSGAQGGLAQEDQEGPGRGAAAAVPEGGLGGSAGAAARATAPAGPSSTSALTGSDPFVAQNLSKKERAVSMSSGCDAMGLFCGLKTGSARKVLYLKMIVFDMIWFCFVSSREVG